MARGRPRGQLNPTRRRVLSYLQQHGPCSIGQVCRATGVERSRLKRIMRALQEISPPNYSPLPKVENIA